MLRDSTAGLNGANGWDVLNAEKLRSGDSEGENGERMGVICSADFIKCAGEFYFIKCSFDPMGSVPIGRGCFC